jgi:hypothetical protein
MPEPSAMQIYTAKLVQENNRIVNSAQNGISTLKKIEAEASPTVSRHECRRQSEIRNLQSTIRNRNNPQSTTTCYGLGAICAIFYRLKIYHGGSSWAKDTWAKS